MLAPSLLLRTSLFKNRAVLVPPVFWPCILVHGHRLLVGMQGCSKQAQLVERSRDLAGGSSLPPAPSVCPQTAYNHSPCNFREL